MKITRDVVLDLLPLVLSGEASPATRELVEEYLKQDPELAELARARPASVPRAAAAAPPPELELKALARTRGLLAVQRWLFALAISLTATGLATSFSFVDGRLTDVHLVARDYPVPLGICLALGAVCWACYLGIRRRLRSRAL